MREYIVRSLYLSMFVLVVVLISILIWLNRTWVTTSKIGTISNNLKIIAHRSSDLGFVFYDASAIMIRWKSNLFSFCLRLEVQDCRSKFYQNFFNIYAYFFQCSPYPSIWSHAFLFRKKKLILCLILLTQSQSARKNTIHTFYIYVKICCVLYA